MISKYITRKGPSEEQIARQPAPSERVIKRRQPRSRGGFKYRNVSFIYVVKGDKISLFTWNDKLNCMNVGVTVDKKDKKKAIVALAKISLAEVELDAVQATPADAGLNVNA